MIDVTLTVPDMHTVEMAFAWSKTQDFNDLRLLTKATFGAKYQKESRTWTVPIDHFFDLADRIKMSGTGKVRLQGSSNVIQHLRDRRNAREYIGDLYFADEVEGWKSPPGLTTEPRGYQQVAATYMQYVPGGLILGDPVGTGKTLDCIIDQLCHPDYDEPNSVLWLVMATLKYNILRQYTLHTSPEIQDRVCLIEGNKKKRAQLWADPRPIKIAGYEGALRADWDILPREWKRVYADEATKFKNSATALSRRIKRLQVRDGIVAITATPVETKPHDLYTIASAVRPGSMGHWWQFRDNFLIVDAWGGYEGLQPDAAAAIGELVAPFMLRREKAKLLPQLPPKVRTQIDVHLTAKEQREYDTMVESFWLWLAEHQDAKTSADPLVAMLRARQYLNSPNIVDPNLEISGSKMETTRELIQDLVAEGEKVVVFTQWTETLKRLADMLEEDGRQVIRVHGGIPAKKRLPLIDEFSESGEVLVTTDALAHGVDIIAASSIIHYDQLWNPAKMLEQREGRLHRSGQEASSVNVYSVIVNATADESIQEVLEWRMAMAESIYDSAVSTLLRNYSSKDWDDFMHGKARLQDAEAS